jgi:hypothetical protein
MRAGRSKPVGVGGHDFLGRTRIYRVERFNALVDVQYNVAAPDGSTYVSSEV